MMAMSSAHSLYIYRRDVHDGVASAHSLYVYRRDAHDGDVFSSFTLRL